jgi:hypothetical protein
MGMQQQAVGQPNPWGSPKQQNTADFWLSSATQNIGATAGGDTSINMNINMTPPAATAQVHQQQQPTVYNQPMAAAAAAPHRAPPLSQTRSHSIDTGSMHSAQLAHKAPTLREISEQNKAQRNWQSMTGQGPTTDPFDVAWAAKAGGKPQPTNPFANNARSVKAFEVQL